jgi:hypothetical protein
MKNPLKKEDHTGLAVGIAVGVAAGIAMAWLYLTESGRQYRKQLGGKIRESLSDNAAALIGKKTIIPKKVAKQRLMP